jgi:hypothetical protein
MAVSKKTVVEVVPVELDAVITYGDLAVTWVGVPEITPVVGFKVSPAGKGVLMV